MRIAVRCLGLALCVIGGWGRCLLADDAASPAATVPAGPTPGHSAHGEAFNEGPRQQARWMGGAGATRFTITTASPDAQRFFDQGLGQLHGFWYFEAERSFRQALLHDPACPMAYWGLALANVNNLKRGREFIAKGVALKDKARRQEQLWIEAVDKFYKDEGDEKQRRRQAVRDLEAILHEFPDDIETKSFLVWLIWNNASHGIDIGSHQAVDALIDQVLAVEPRHPVLHYRIHLWDGEKPSRAVMASATCGQAAPAVAHMWHMPGHIFSGLKRYRDACWQQEAATRVDHAYMMRDQVLPDQIHNYAHNSEWLIRDLLFVGRVRDALALSQNLIEMPRHPQHNTLSRPGTAQYGRTRLFDTVLTYELWDELLSATAAGYLEPTDQEEQQVRLSRALGVARLERGEWEAAGGIITTLEIAAGRLANERRIAENEAEAKARAENKPDDQIKKAREQAGQSFDGRQNNLRTALGELRGVRALKLGDFAEAWVEFDQSNKLSDVFLARARLQAGDLPKAEELARKGVGQGENQVVPLANAVFVLHHCGKKDDARTYFEKLRPLAADAELQWPVFQRLRPIAAELGYPEDWRIRETAPTDIGERPNLDSLGPYLWQPTAAPEWRLPGGDGAEHALTEWRGKPVVLIFYLGNGCVHCVDQLKKFRAQHALYEAAGLKVVAISTDPVDDLKNSLEAEIPGGNPPFLFLSDHGLQTFRAYRCHDDFENVPLHGTFLIDAAGRIRWHDTGYEPFMDPAFLLEESRRLLKL